MTLVMLIAATVLVSLLIIFGLSLCAAAALDHVTERLQ